MNSSEIFSSVIQNINLGTFQSSVHLDIFLRELEIGRKEIPEMDLLTCNANLQNIPNVLNENHKATETKIKPAWKCTGKSRKEVGLGPLDELFSVHQSPIQTHIEEIPQQYHSEQISSYTANESENLYSNERYEESTYNFIYEDNYHDSQQQPQLMSYSNLENNNEIQTIADLNQTNIIIWSDPQNWNVEEYKPENSSYSPESPDSMYTYNPQHGLIHTDERWDAPRTLLGKIIDSESFKYL